MRVIAGTARSLQLKTVPGMDTRPTTDRIKETLFNILSPELPDCVFLDLFSGSGGIGIEALSRGAQKAYFVDNSRSAVHIIQENLEHTRFSARAEVLACDAVHGIQRLEQKGVICDVIFMDPPYHKGLEEEILRMLASSTILHDDTLIVAESALDTEFDSEAIHPLTIHRVKSYKTNKHTFFYKEEEEQG